MRLIPLQHLREGTVLAIDILNERSTPLLKKGMTITALHIKKLKELGVASVYATDEYCSYDHDASYVAQPSNILREVVLLRQLIRKANAGLCDLENFALVDMSVHKIIKELSTNKDVLRISYEPKKLLIHDFEERTIYTAIMSALLALKLNRSIEVAHDVCLSVIVRDIGLIAPKVTLAGTYSEIKHPLLGHDYLKENYPIKPEILEMVLQHHEYYDGTGYPNKLKGNEICDLAKIATAIDLFYDIKTKHFNISSANSLIKTFNKISTKVDPFILAIFLSNVDMYTPDTLVRLTNNDLAVVMKNTSTNPFTPTVKLIASTDYDAGTTLHLDKISSLRVRNIVYYPDSIYDEE